jgi:hypothetical protein
MEAQRQRSKIFNTSYDSSRAMVIHPTTGQRDQFVTKLLNENARLKAGRQANQQTIRRSRKRETLLQDRLQKMALVSGNLLDNATSTMLDEDRFVQIERVRKGKRRDESKSDRRPVEAKLQFMQAKFKTTGLIASARVGPCLDVVTTHIATEPWKESWSSATSINRIVGLIHQMELIFLMENLKKAINITYRWDLSPQVN